MSVVPIKTNSRPSPREVGRVLLFRSPLTYHPHVWHEDPHPPLELLYLAAVLKPNYDVKVLDGQRRADNVQDFGPMKRMGLSDDEIVREAVEFGPDLIGLSVMWHNQTPAALYFAGLLKETFPEVPIVVGGIGPSSSPGMLLESPHIDYAISGDGELSLVALCEALTAGSELSEVAGLSYTDGSTVTQVPKQNIASLDTIPFPALELVDLEVYSSGYENGYHKAHPMSGVLPSRGCPLACHFCSLPAVSDQLYRTHSIERVISDMLRMRDEFGVREVHFYDDNLLNNRKFCKELFKAMIDHNLGLHWLQEAGFALWKIDEEILELAKASGMFRIDLPIETGTDRVRGDIMNKGFYQNLEVASIVKMARSVGIEQVFGYVIVGSPGETIENMKYTLDFINSLDFDYRGVKYAQPFPGTRFFEVCNESGYLAAEFALDRLWFGMPNIETTEFTLSQVTTLVASDRAAALIRQGRVSYQDAIEELRVKHSEPIAQDAAALIPELQRRYEKNTQEFRAALQAD